MPSNLTVAFFIFLQLTQNIGCYAECQCRKKSENSVTETVSGALKYGGLALAAAPILLPLAGFTAGGIAAGSVAAGVQSAWFGGTIGGVTGWLFSGLQSLGAAGIGFSGKAAVVSSTVALYDSVTGEKCDC